MRCYNTAILTKGLLPPICLPVEVDSDKELYQIPIRGNEVETRLLSISDANLLNPLADIETDLGALLRAGIHPNELNVSHLLTPTSVESLSEVADLRAGQVILEYEKQIKALKSENNNNNSNLQENEQQTK